MRITPERGKMGRGVYGRTEGRASAFCRICADESLPRSVLSTRSLHAHMPASATPLPVDPVPSRFGPPILRISSISRPMCSRNAVCPSAPQRSLSGARAVFAVLPVARACAERSFQLRRAEGTATSQPKAERRRSVALGSPPPDQSPKGGDTSARQPVSFNIR